MATRLKALESAALPHIARGTDARIFAAIKRDEVTLALWERPPIGDIVAGDTFEDVRIETSLARCEAALHEVLVAIDPVAARPLVGDIALLSTCYGAIMGLDRVAIRLERVTGKACWRFHSDFVTVRLLSTYRGPGTQWLPRASRSKASFKELRTGDVGLFKGRLLAGQDAILHRSPPLAEWDEPRLLLVIDPPASELERARRRVIDQLHREMG